MGRLFYLPLALFLTMESSITLVFAQQTDSVRESAITERPLAKSQIEEITVVGIQSLNDLRVRIEQAEDEVYSFFNANNSSNRMDIICSGRRPTGTNMLKRECEPRFLRDLRVLKTRESRMGIGFNFNLEDLVDWSAEDFETLQSEMLVLMAEYPEFSQRLAQLSALAKDFNAQVTEMFGDKQDSL